MNIPVRVRIFRTGTLVRPRDTPFPKEHVKMEEASRPLKLDDRFAVNVSDSMELRNALRAGLVEAQGRESDKIPIFVSWPEWLEDGIVCIYARDLHELLRSAVRDTAEALTSAMEPERER